MLSALIIRTAQMEALRQARQREFAASLAAGLRDGHPHLCAGRSAQELATLARTGIGMADRLGLLAADEIERLTVCLARHGTGFAAQPWAGAVLNDDLLAPGEKLRRLECHG